MLRCLQSFPSVDVFFFRCLRDQSPTSFKRSFVNATVMAANFGAGGPTGTVPDLAGNVALVLKVI